MSVQFVPLKRKGEVQTKKTPLCDDDYTNEKRCAKFKKCETCLSESPMVLFIFRDVQELFRCKLKNHVPKLLDQVKVHVMEC